MVAWWAQMLDGDRPRSLPMAAGGGAALAVVAGSREAREWANEITHMIAGRALKSACAWPDHGSHAVTSRQDIVCSFRHVSPCPPVTH